MLAKSYLGIASAAVAASPPLSEQASCFVPSDADSVVISSMSALATAVNNAPPGRQILIAPGTYSGDTLAFDGNGADGDPIVVRPQNGLGTVTINSARWTYDAGSSHIVLSSLFFNGPRITFQGSFNRITRCRFRQINTECVIPDVLTNSRIDHCDFSDYISSSGDRICIRFRNGPVGARTTRRILVDYCYFHDINTTSGVTNPILVPQASMANACTANAEIVIDHCLFENIDRAGSNQDVDIKCSGVKVRFCSFVGGGNSYLQMRKGNNCEFRSNWFENVSSRPIGIFGDNHLVIGNRIVGAGNTMWICSGDEPALACNTAGYAPATNCRVIGNIVDGDLDVGRHFDGLTKTDPAENNMIEAHTGTIDTSTDSAWHTGTVTNPTASEPYVAAVKLTATDVGLNAADPLCD
jgi:hypothetical protein